MKFNLIAIYKIVITNNMQTVAKN